MMSHDRPAIPIEIRREVLFEARHHCAVCCNPLPLEQAHVIPWSESHEHSVANLIALCANCHSRADGEKWGVKVLQKYKRDPCILARKSNAPEGSASHLIQFLEVLVQKQVEEMMLRSPELGSAIAAYTAAPGEVEVVSVRPANSSRVVLSLPKEAAQKFMAGFEQRDPLLLAFLDDFEVLAVRPLHQSRTAKIAIDKSALKPEHLRRIKSLALLNDQQIADFLEFIDLVSCAQSTTLFHEGQPGDSMFLILEGQMWQSIFL